jgi:hypothetical protein
MAKLASTTSLHQQPVNSQIAKTQITLSMI